MGSGLKVFELQPTCESGTVPGASGSLLAATRRVGWRARVTIPCFENVHSPAQCRRPRRTKQLKTRGPMPSSVAPPVQGAELLAGNDGNLRGGGGCRGNSQLPNGGDWSKDTYSLRGQHTCVAGVSQAPWGFDYRPTSSKTFASSRDSTKSDPIRGNRSLSMQKTDDEITRR